MYEIFRWDGGFRRDCVAGRVEEEGGVEFVDGV